MFTYVFTTTYHNHLFYLILLFSITCTNLASSKLSTVLSTRGGAGLKDNFTLVFGFKSVSQNQNLFQVMIF